MSGDAPDSPVIPAGWYTDPADPAGKRWWDGQRWTADVIAPEPPPVSTFGGAAPLARTENAYVPFASTHTIAPATTETGVAYTRAGWWICAHPFWGVATQAVAVTLLNFTGAPPAGELALGLVAVNIVFLGILIALAFADRAALLAGGNGSAASPWWMLLSPLGYLIARALEVRRWEVGGWASVIWWSVALILTPGLVVLGVFAVLGLVGV
jgi:hypothetical protein